MDLSRRQLLATTTVLTVPIAGCTGEQTGADGGTEETTEETGMVEDTTTEEAETTEETEETETTEETEETETDEPTSAETLLSTRSTEEYGDIVVGPEGMTLYMFDNDTQGSGESVCTNGCAEAWPPLTVESEDEVSMSEDVTAEVDTFERPDGSIQVSVAGWPVYYFQNDESAGDVAGQGVQDVWWVLGPDGEPIRSAESATKTTTEETGGDDDGGDGDGEGSDDDSGSGSGGQY